MLEEILLVILLVIQLVIQLVIILVIEILGLVWIEISLLSLLLSSANNHLTPTRPLLPDFPLADSDLLMNPTPADSFGSYFTQGCFL